MSVFTETEEVTSSSPEAAAPERPVSWLNTPALETLPDAMKKLLRYTQDNMGFVHNFYRAFSVSPAHALGFAAYFGALFDEKKSELSARERELIIVVVSAENRCEFCLVSHAAALREITGDPTFVETVSINYRRADLTDRERLLADFAVRVTRESYALDKNDLDPLRALGLTDAGIMEVVEIIATFNYTNRLANTLGFKPNDEFFTSNR